MNWLIRVIASKISTWVEARTLSRDRVDDLRPTRVRVTNYNRALVWPFFALLCYALIVVLTVLPEGKGEQGSRLVPIAVVSVFALLFTVASLRAVLWVEFSELITIKRLLGTKLYPLTEVDYFSFRDANGEVWRKAPQGPSALEFTFKDGLEITLIVSEPRARAIAHVYLDQLPGR